VQPAAERMPDVWVSLEQSKRVLDGIDERPAEGEKLLPRCARENDFGHASAGGSTVAQLAAKIVERHRLAARKVGEAGFDGVERWWIGEDLSGFFERLVLVDGDECSGRLAVASHEHVIAAVGDVAEQLAELRSELPNWNDLRHPHRVYRIAYTAPLACGPSSAPQMRHSRLQIPGGHVPLDRGPSRAVQEKIKVLVPLGRLRIPVAVSTEGQ
jgi:hypothetical protein